jgi:hypothetical protein
MGIEPTWDSLHCPTPDLKSGSPTSELSTSGSEDKSRPILRPGTGVVNGEGEGVPSPGAGQKGLVPYR